MNLLKHLPLPQLSSTTRRLAGSWLGLSVITLVALNLLQLGFPSGVARAAAYPCTEAGLNAALAAGGVATFNCSGPTTLTLTTAKTVNVSGTVLDGGALLTLDGSNVANSMFYVPSGVTATFQNMELTKGQGQNSAGNYSGGAIFSRGTVTVFNDIFSNNGIVSTTSMNGGAIYSEGPLTVQNSTFFGNQGYFGGAIRSLYTSLNVSNSTFSGNLKAGVTVYVDDNSTANINSSTFYGNGSLDINQYRATSVNVKNTIAQNAAGINDQGNNLIGVNQLLNPLASNGGYVPTMSLQPCSPAINAGNSAGAPATDERGAGFPRILQGAMDIGAFESNLLPCLSINNVTQNEGNAGTTSFTFTVSLSAVSTLPITVNYATADGTATIADNDYAATASKLTFNPGTTTQTVTVLVNGDTKKEPNETFTVNLSNPANATLVTATGTGTIINDDGVPAISIGDVSQAEGNSGTTAFNFPVTLSAAATTPVVVQYATADGTATLADNDYAAATGTLTIPAGQTTGSITVNVNGDTKVEPNETFTVSLSNPTGAALGKATGIGTIVNDDNPPPATPAVSVADVRQREGDKGTTAFNFTVRLSPAAATTVTVNYATLDDTATVADKDYQATSGSLTFAPGETAKTVTVLVNGDTKIEPDEVFFLVLTNPTGANLGKGTAQGVILNDDGEVDEADLIGKLRVTPDREFDLDGKGLLTYVLTVKNIGLGASSPPAVQLPIDADFQVAYASFTTDSVPGAFYEKTVTDPVTAVLPYAVLPYAQLRLPALAPGQTVTATIAMVVAPGAKPSNLNTRFAIVWDNLDGKPHHYYSNRVHLHLGQGTTRNETDGLVQFLTASGDGIGLDEQGRATVQLGGDIYAPGERVYVWYTDGNGKSTSLGYVWADLHTGELDTQLVIPGWQSGQRYFLAALGDRSGVIGSATVLVQSRTTTQNLAENGSDITSSSYSYTQVAPLFNGQALQNLLSGFTSNQ